MRKKDEKKDRELSRRVVVAGLAAVVPSCVIAGGVGVPPVTTSPDAGDLLDARVAEDAGSDAGADAGSDAGTDAGTDAGDDGGITPQCIETEDNILGPFYRGNAPFRSDLRQPNDVARLVIEGTVRGLGCGLLNQALLDVWQAGESGDYDNTTADFKWRGRLNTDSNGFYRFETALPGRYLNGNTFRPRHIHLRVSAPGHVLLTTQLYFAGDPYLSSDPFVRNSLVIPLTQKSGFQQGEFHIVLAPS